MTEEIADFARRSDRRPRTHSQRASPACPDAGERGVGRRRDAFERGPEGVRADSPPSRSMPMTLPETISADYTLRPSELAEVLALLVEARQPTMVWGPPGAAKSMIARQVAATASRRYVDVRALLLDPVDLRGIPWRDSADRTRWAPPVFLPPSDDPGLWLINLEELPSAVPMVQAALYQLFLERKCGEYELPEGASLIACGNRDADRAVVHRMAGSGAAVRVQGEGAAAVSTDQPAGGGTMQTTSAAQRCARTFLTHFFGGGLDDDRYVVQRFPPVDYGDKLPSRPVVHFYAAAPVHNLAAVDTQAPGAPHPPALAAHPPHLPGGQPLRTDRGHGLVRGQRRRLHLRPGGQSRAAPPLIRGGRRPQGAPRRGRRRKDAVLRRLRLRRRFVEPRTPGRRPAGGDRAGLRRPATSSPRSAETPATSSPRSAETPAISTKISTAPAAKPRTSSSCTRASSRRTAPPARARSPTSSASSCTPRPTG